MGLSQDALAERVFVTRQAVSRWENGDTVPNTETLKLLSDLFDVSINTFLEAYDFSGKKIILFATSGGSGFGNTAAELKGSVSDSTEIVEGKVISPRMTEKDITRWVATLNL